MTDDGMHDIQELQRKEEVDVYLKKGIKPPLEVIKNWNMVMQSYFRNKWEAMQGGGEGSNDKQNNMEEDVLEV